VAVRCRCAADPERWGEQGKVVRKGLLFDKVDPIGDKEELGPSPKGRAGSVDANVNGSIHDGAKIL
jgi:hypothetical protein